MQANIVARHPAGQRSFLSKEIADEGLESGHLTPKYGKDFLEKPLCPTPKIPRKPCWAMNLPANKQALKRRQLTTSTPFPSVEEQFKALELKAAEHYDAWLRAKAEGENIRRRAQEDISKAHKFAVEKFAGELLAVKDSLEAALAVPEQTVESFKSGVELTLKQLVSAFEKYALNEVNPAGEKFDPH